MKIYYNIAAMQANNALAQNDTKLSSSIQRLSSGLKINSAQDNPSGLAMAKRMRAQIDGLERANRNSQDGVSLINIADGALGDVEEMLQRMNELAIQSANGTMSASDRQAIQNEVEQLQAEITRVAKETEFNSQTLMDGSFDLKGFTNNLTTKVVTYSDTVPTGKYTIDSLTVLYGDEGKITDAVKTGTDLGPEYKIEATDDDKVTITGENDFSITLFFPTPEEMAAFDFSALTPTTTTTTTPTANGESVVTVEEYTINQNGYQGTYTRTTTTLTETVDGVDNETVTVEENYELTGTAEGKEGTYNMVTTSTTQTTGIGTENEQVTETKTVNGSYVLTGLELDITNLGAMRLQVGANENQVINVRIPKVSLETLGIDDMDIKTEKTATEAITKIAGAIDYISAERSRLGAYQNRLESNIANLDVSTENMTSAYSRIMDVDMAEEMTQYSTYQVLTQTSTSMLAQANDRPSQVLQILQ